MTSSQSASSSGLHQQRQPQVFEFTKRKRWADILISELPETIILVLSMTCKVLYCGTGVGELLGWSVEDLVDADITSFINDDDQHNFRDDFQRSVETKQELFSYARLKCKRELVTNPNQSTSQKELLFEIKGHPHYMPEDNECKCFFAMAKLYPSRNTAILNTFLELKMENERLSQRVADLRSRSVMASATGSMPPPLAIPMPVPSQMSPFSPVSYGSARPDESMTTPTRTTFEMLGMSGYGHGGGGYSGAPLSADADDDDGRGKKKKKMHPTENQYVCVTCGRTDSPEWRKGPLGPKTLCNACGLRWSKKSRKHEDSTSGPGPGPSAQIQSIPDQPQQWQDLRPTGGHGGYGY